MLWFDSPAIGLRKLLPNNLLARFNDIEILAMRRIEGQPAEHKPYQLGVVLALWLKAAEAAGEAALPASDSRKVQSIYESCMKILRDKSLVSFQILTEMAAHNRTFGMPAEIYLQAAFNVSR